MPEDPPSPSPSSSSSSVSSKFSSTWLKFFVKFRRILIQSRRPRKQLQFESKKLQFESKTEEKEEEQGRREKVEEGGEIVMQKAVKNLLFGKWEEREMAAVEIKRLAEEDVKIRKNLAELGVIPPLVEMADSGDSSRGRSAIQALLQLADGTFTNKALILEAGILSKLPKDIYKVDESTIHDLSQLLLSISSLSNTQFPLNPSSLLPFLLATLQSKSTTDKSKEACLGILFNLSSVLENSGPLISNHVEDILLDLVSSSREVSEKALATLGNLVVTLMGKKALEDNNMVPESLIDVLTWEDKPKCQELSAYILMILAHQNPKQREKMAKFRIVHVLLEVALLGSPLAQKRALKLLQCFKDERQVKVGSHSGPQTRRVSIGLVVSERETNEGNRLMKKMVKQSLYKNMEVITRRANAAGESSKLKSLVISSSSKSLPY